MRKEESQKEFLSAYEEYADAIFRFCYVKTGDRELAKDLVQDVFLKIWPSIEKGEVGNMRPFLYKIATNLVIDWYRRKKSVSLDALAEEGFDPPDQDSETKVKAEMGWTMEVLKKLEKTDRDLIVWRFVEDLSPREIAEILGEEENTVSVRIHRAVGRLRNLINP